jgi:hypothetical protein
MCIPSKSVYAELALNIGTYLLDRYRPTAKERLVAVSDMVVQKALIAPSSGSLWLQATANVDWAK